MALFNSQQQPPYIRAGETATNSPFASVHTIYAIMPTWSPANFKCHPNFILSELGLSKRGGAWQMHGRRLYSAITHVMRILYTDASAVIDDCFRSWIQNGDLAIQILTSTESKINYNSGRRIELVRMRHFRPKPRWHIATPAPLLQWSNFAVFTTAVQRTYWHTRTVFTYRVCSSIGCSIARPYSYPRTSWKRL